MKLWTKIFALPVLFLGLSGCDLYERIRDNGVIDSSSFSVFQSYSGKKCRIQNSSGSKELSVDCQRLKDFLFADSNGCTSGRFTPAKGYFPDESNAINLCVDYSIPEFREKEEFRVLIFADSGAGQSKNYGYAQIEVADAMTTLCTAEDKPCDFAIVSGDLVYPSGVDDVFDADFEKRFEDVYAGFGDMPFFVVPGNHDYRGNVIAQVEYTYFSKRWRMLKRYYKLPDLPDWLHIVGLDTTALLGEEDTERLVGKQRTLYEESTCDQSGWSILFGHHTAFSNGKHGSDFEMARQLNTLTDMCDLDMYVSGHDHIQEHIHTPKYEQFVQGAGGAKVSSVDDVRGEDTFADESVGGFPIEQRFGEGTHGFAIADITADTVEMYFFATSTWKYEDGEFKTPPDFEDYIYHCTFTKGDEDGCQPD